MAIQLIPETWTIFIPKADLTFVAGALYELDVNWFRLQLKDLEDDAEGIVYPDTHSHNTEVLLSGVVYARTVEILSPWVVEFEDDGTMNGHYVVRCVGANHNLADVKVLNSVSLIIGNSAGLVVTGTSGLTAEESAAILSLATDSATMSKILRNRKVTDPVTGILTIYDDDGVTPWMTAQLYEDTGQTQTYRGRGAEERERLEP